STWCLSRVVAELVPATPIIRPPPSLPRRAYRMWHGASSPSPRLRGEGRGEGAWPQAEVEGPRPLTLARFARSTSPRKRGEVKAVPHGIALPRMQGRGREGAFEVAGTSPATTRKLVNFIRAGAPAQALRVSSFRLDARLPDDRPPFLRIGLHQ